MPLVNLTEAAKLAGKSRSYFHTNYIKKGKISVNRSDPKNPKVDTSELLRVFGELTTNTNEEHTREQQETSKENTELLLETERLKAEVEGLKALVKAKDEQIKRESESTEEARQRANIAEQQYKNMLEDKMKRDKELNKIEELEEALQHEKSKGFWSRLFGS